MKLRKTERGFYRAEFKDLDGTDCSIPESSLGEALWLGCNKGTPHHLSGDCMARMPLDRERVAKLIPLLQKFVDMGRWAEEK